MRHAILHALVGVGLMATAGLAGEIGFVEDFALAKDRTVPLKQLVPGTEDYYYYSCLQAQNTGKLDEVDGLLKVWIERHNRTSLVQEIENRQALLRYAKSPKEALAFLRDRLGLSFGHQREVLGQKPQLPTSLDEKLISREIAQMGEEKKVLGLQPRNPSWASSVESVQSAIAFSSATSTAMSSTASTRRSTRTTCSRARACSSTPGPSPRPRRRRSKQRRARSSSAARQRGRQAASRADSANEPAPPYGGRGQPQKVRPSERRGPEKPPAIAAPPSCPPYGGRPYFISGRRGGRGGREKRRASGVQGFSPHSSPLRLDRW